jgi:hypothetical protein
MKRKSVFPHRTVKMREDFLEWARRQSAVKVSRPSPTSLPRPRPLSAPDCTSGPTTAAPCPAHQTSSRQHHNGDKAMSKNGKKRGQNKPAKTPKERKQSRMDKKEKKQKKDSILPA